MYTREQTGKSPAEICCGASATKGIFFSAWPYRMIRFVLAGIFLWSGISKLVDPKSFAVIIEAFGLIPDDWIMPLAMCLPVLEVIAALGLLIDIRGSLTVITALLVLFMGILGYGVWMGLDIDCGCFGPEDPEADAYHGLRPALYRDIVMMAGICYLYFWRFHRSASPVRLKAIFKNKSGEEH